MPRKPVYDPSELTSGIEAESWVAHAKRKAVEYDVYGDKTTFRVRVLSRPNNISKEDYKAIFGSDTVVVASGTDFKRYMFKGRIETEEGVPSPHRTLPDPGTIEDSADPECTARIISWHTTFVSSDSITGPRPEVGDIVTVTLAPGDLGKYNLQFATFEDMQGQASNPGLSTNRAAAASSARLTTLFTAAATQPNQTQPLQQAASVTPTPSGTPTPVGDTLMIDNHAVYPYAKNTTANMVVFYHGVGYGNQKYVLDKLKSLPIPANTMFLVPGAPNNQGHNVNYASVVGTIGKLKTAHGINIAETRIGGWSGGSKGFMTAFDNSGSPKYSFTKMMLADPSPERKAFGSSLTQIPKNVYMEYRPANWSGKWDPSGKLKLLAPKIEAAGGTAILSSMNHKDILVSILRKISS